MYITKTFIDEITNRPAYLCHTILDAGNSVILVLTTTNQWFLYYNEKWVKQTDKEALTTCNSYWLGYRYNEMKECLT